VQETLPIAEILEETRRLLDLHTVVILQAAPGAGKSTWLPLQLMNEKWLAGKKIKMLEPRRLAAKTVAARLASQLQEEAGETVGYRIRFENKISAGTQLEILTEGILTRMLQEDGALEDTGLVIFDEFHERSLHADLALALCRNVQQVLRPDLRILIMSATIDGEKLSALLGNAPIITSKGRQFPIEYNYVEADTSLNMPQQMARLIRRAMREQLGDVLAFFPGTAEINQTAALLEEENSGARICPLYGDLPLHEQQEAIQPDPYGLRKIVLATSIAETSLTIQGIKIVVDSGWSRVPRFDPNSGLTRLETVRVTKDAADQRAGRAGRLGPGICYRLWAEGYQHHLVAHRNPEILEADLAPLVLDLAQWGSHISALDWITIPPNGAVLQAEELLRQLGAIHEKRITNAGKEMARLPTHPRIAHLITEAQKTGLAALASDLAAVLEERDPLGRNAETDLVLRIDALRKWRLRERVDADRKRLERIERIALAWRKLIHVKVDNTTAIPTDVGKLLAAAYPERIAKKENANRFRLANGKTGKLPEHDALQSETWIAIAHLDSVSGKEARIFLAAPLDPADVIHLAEEKNRAEWDTQKDELVACIEKRIGGIILESKPVRQIEESQRLEILIAYLRETNMKALLFSEEVQSLQARIQSLCKWHPEENWPDFSHENLLNTMEEWLSPYLNSIRKRIDFEKLDLFTILGSSIPWEKQQELNKRLPEKIEVPSGSFIRIQYHSDGASPILAVRLQELFGMLETPRINNGKTNLVIHLLSPAYRPVQVTQDLASFWKNTYAEVRKELRPRYPKHSWPEDPYTAEAIRGIKRK
jgi:ATP-dependent helicase HrpB